MLNIKYMVVIYVCIPIYIVGAAHEQHAPQKKDTYPSFMAALGNATDSATDSGSVSDSESEESDFDSSFFYSTPSPQPLTFKDCISCAFIHIPGPQKYFACSIKSHSYRSQLTTDTPRGGPYNVLASYIAIASSTLSTEIAKNIILSCRSRAFAKKCLPLLPHSERPKPVSATIHRLVGGIEDYPYQVSTFAMNHKIQKGFIAMLACTNQ